MRLPFRKPKIEPATDLYNDETVAVPIIETNLPIIEPQKCACCGTIGAPHQFVNGDLYLKRLEHNYLCDACYGERERARKKHNVANHKTVQEHPTVRTGGLIQPSGTAILPHETGAEFVAFPSDTRIYPNVGY